jgi:EpsI family protein
MNTTAVRLVLVVGIVVLVQLGFQAIGAGTRLPEVLDPTTPLRELPMKLDDWRGENAELDAKTFASTGADTAISRSYQNAKTGIAVSALIATYKTMAALYHSPENCYRSNGWTALNATTVTLTGGDRPEIPVKMTTYEQDNERGKQRVMILYWYEVGDNVMFTREDTLRVQWAMRGRKAWPPIYKVLLQTELTSETDIAKKSLLDLASTIRKDLGAITPADTQ